jgi:hypothetical protein
LFNVFNYDTLRRLDFEAFIVECIDDSDQHLIQQFTIKDLIDNILYILKTSERNNALHFEDMVDFHAS